jgi:hypothetical protein
MSERLEKYKYYLDKALSYYYDDLTFIKYFHKVPKSRYYTFKYVLDYIKDNNLKNILELGTSRSYVDGRFEGCNSDDIKYWEPENPEKWDWSAGLFTRVFAESLNNYKCNIYSLDSNKYHIERSKNILGKYSSKVKYFHSLSEDFLKSTDMKFDVIYLDTGDMTPIEDTAMLQLVEAHIIVERDLLNKGGLLLIDDVRNPTPKIAGETNNLGKSKYSVQYLMKHGFKLVMGEYQVILKKE